MIQQRPGIFFWFISALLWFAATASLAHLPSARESVARIYSPPGGMGIKDLKSRLPSVRKNIFKPDPGLKIAVDASNVLFTCLRNHALDAKSEIFEPTLADFKHMMMLWKKNNVNFMLVYDGCAYGPKEKYERARREEGRQAAEDKYQLDPSEERAKAAISITPMLASLSMAVCDILGITYCVAPTEADGQLAYMATQGFVVFSQDTDNLALNVTKWMAPVNGGYYTGDVDFFDLSTYGDSMIDTFPLISCYLSFGPAAFIYWGALRGCDFSSFASGIPGVGGPGALAALKRITTLSPEGIVEALKVDSLPQMPEQYKADFFHQVCA